MDNLEPQPAGYSHTDTAEVEAINVLRVSLDANLVKADIRERDKYPNIDGYLELVDSSGRPKGKLEVQVRKIPDNQTKYQCPVDLFAYAGRTALPVLLICVDTKNKKVFWRHIKDSDFPYGTSQKSVNITFDPNHSEITADKKYYVRWLEITSDYIQRVRDHNSLQILSANATSMAKVHSEVIGKIQTFLDELNGLLDGNYSCIKHMLFPGVWKLGFGLFRWGAEGIEYALFPIENGQNRPLICQLDPNLNIFSDPNIGAFGYYGRNEIARNPKSAAREYVYNSFKEILTQQALLARIPYLCREYLIAYIDRYSYCLGLQYADSYDLSQIKRAVNDYLPRWCEIALRNVRSYPAHLKYASPDLIRMMLPKSIEPEVEKAILEKTVIPPITVKMSGISYGIIFDLLAYCEKDGISKIERVYKTRTAHTGRMIWDGYTEEDAFYNFKLVYENFEKVYSEFLKTNGLNDPALSLFSGQEFQVYKYVHPAPPLKDYPGQDIYRLTPDSGCYVGPRIIVLPLKDNSFKYSDPLDGPPEAQLGSDKYKLKSYSMGIADFLYQPNPMLNLIYKTLLDRLDTAVKANAKL